MNLMEIIPDGEMQIHMIVHGEFRIKESATTQESEMVRLGAFQRDTRYYQRGVNCAVGEEMDYDDGT